MSLSSSQRDSRSARSEVNSRGGRCVGIGVGITTITQLSLVVPSPALHVSVVKDGAGEVPSSMHRNSCSARSEVNRSG